MSPRRLARTALSAALAAAPLAALDLAAVEGAARRPPSTGRPPAPARADGAERARAGRVRFGDVRLATGVRLHYAEQGRPGGHAVILLHGYSDSWASFSRLLPLLPERLHVVAPDQRGHGDSDRPAAGYAVRDLAADVVALMDAKGIARATVVGHSMGSFVAQQVALAAPGRVDGLVLVGSARSLRHFAGVDGLGEALGGFAGDEAPVPEAFARDFQRSTVHRAVPAAFMDTAVAASRRLPLRVWRALLDGMLAAEPAAGLAARRTPALVLWGDRDAYAPRAEQDSLLRLLPGGAFRAYPATGHSPHWERPADVARDVVGFVDGVGAAR